MGLGINLDGNPSVPNPSHSVLACYVLYFRVNVNICDQFNNNYPVDGAIHLAYN